jgi:autotransporter-associated beta strand protein
LPKNVIFSNNSLAYTINGPYGIAGTGSVLLNGAGSVTINSNNSYSGGTTISTGTLTLAGSNTTTGATVVNSGTLNINSANALGTGALTINSGTIDNTSGAPIVLATTNAMNWNGDFTFGGTNDLDLGANNVPLTATRTITANGSKTLTINSVISGTGFGFAKSGSGSVKLTGANTYDGSTIIHGGTLEVAGGTLGSTNANIQISPESGDSGTFTVSNGTVNADRVIIGGNSANNGTPGNGNLIQTGGTINSREWFTVGSGGGGNSLTGTYTLSGGTLNVITQLMEVSNFAGSSGTVTMSGGAINLQSNVSLVMGSNNTAGDGTFTQNGGTVTFYSDAGLTKGGTGVLNIGRAGTLTSTYTYNLNGGTLSVPQITRNTANTANGYFNFNGGTLQATQATTTWMQNLTAAAVLDGGAIIDDGGYAVTIAQNLATASATDGGLKKQGTGTLTLSGASYWYGPTVVNAGTLNVTGSLSSGQATINAGATLRVSGAGDVSGITGIVINGAGAKMVYNSTSSSSFDQPVTVTNGTLDGVGTITISNTVTVGSGTGVIANGAGGTGALTIGNLTFNGAGTINLNTASTSPVLITTNLITSLSSSDKITINATNSSWISGTTYDLISYTSLTGVGFADFLKGTVSGLTPRQTATLSNPAGYIALTISATSGNPIWSGKVNNKWTTVPVGGLGNWQIGGSANEFLASDAVIFDDTATANTAVNISDANVSPTSTTFNNSTKNYTISSTGGFGITSGFMEKNGTGTVTITTSNTYAVGTTVNAGVFNINNASAIGTGPLTINGGTINNTSGADIVLTTNNLQNWNGDFAFTGTNSLNIGTGDVTLGGTAGQRTINVPAGALAVGSIPTAATGIGITKTGAGTLSLTGSTVVNNIDGTLNIAGGTFEVASDTHVTGLTGSGTLQPYLTSNKWFFVDNATANTFSGVIQSGAGFLGFNKGGSGTLTLTGSNNYNLATTVRQGKLVFSGTTNNTAQADNVGETTASVDAVLVLSPGSTFGANYNAGNVWNSSINIGANASGAGAMLVVNGSTFNAAQQLAVGNAAGAYGAYTQTGGTATIGGFLALGLAGSNGVFNMSGGTFTMSNAPATIGANNSSGFGIVNLSGTAAFTMNATGDLGLWIGETGAGVLNVSNNATLTIASGNNGLELARGTGSGTVNLLGGTVTAQSVYQGTGTGTLNFNGGTLKANASNATFLTGLTNTYVYSGGAKIDDGGYAITVGQALLAPTSNGVSAAGLTTSGGGYIDTPIVQISGDGVGATAVANIDSNGNLTSVTMTNPGIGYTYASFSLVGGGVNNSGSISGTPTIVANIGGGLTKLGSGTMTLTATNTYTGNTLINNGTLLATLTAALPNYGTLGKVQVASGATVAASVGGATEWSAADVKTLHDNATFSAGSFLGLDTTNATGSFTYSDVISGNKGLKKLGTNSLVLDVAETYTGNTVINNGTLELASTGQIATASAISTATTTAIFQIDGGTHTVGNISGIGSLNVAAGATLNATSIVQGTVTLGVGSRITIAPIAGGPQAGGSLTTVPEPSTWAMLMLAVMGLGMYWRRSR